MVPGPFPPAGKDAGGFRAGKLFSYHLKTGMQCFSKASLQAATTSRAILAFFVACPCFPWMMGRSALPQPQRGAGWRTDLLHLQPRSVIA